MSLYVRVFTNFYTHRKTARLRAAIGDAAFWVPPRLWAYAAENQPDGNFSGYSAEELANLIGYAGDAPSMLQALLQAGLMDSDPLRIHDWPEHNGYHKSYADRARQAATARWEKQRAGQSAPLPPVPYPERERKGKEPSNASSILGASERPAALLRQTPSPLPSQLPALIAEQKRVINRTPDNDPNLPVLRQKLAELETLQFGAPVTKAKSQKRMAPAPSRPVSNPDPDTDYKLLSIREELTKARNNLANCINDKDRQQAEDRIAALEENERERVNELQSVN